MARHDENVETVVILEKVIIAEDSGCVWMALNVQPVPPSVVVALLCLLLLEDIYRLHQYFHLLH